MFQTFLNSIPKNRSEMVNELELPDVTVSPYLWEDVTDSITTRSDSILTTSSENVGPRTLDTDSSIPLSRAMTDSEIDYGMYKRFKHRIFSDPWDEMRAIIDKFPPGHFGSLNSFQTSSETTEMSEEMDTKGDIRRHSEELRLKMKKFFDEECTVFRPEDPGLESLDNALRNVDMKALEDDLDNIIIP